MSNEREQPSMLVAARAMLAAVSAASRQGKPLACAIVDRDAHVIALQRDPRTSFLTGEIALAKARAAALLGAPTSVSQERAEQRPALYERLEALSAGPMVHVPGGVPIVVDDVIVGAIGVSGDTPARDEEYAQHARDHVFPPTST